MTTKSRWIGSQNTTICYAVRFLHPLYRFFQFIEGFGPFPTAAEAGKALDQLLVHYPTAVASVERMRPEELADWSIAALEKSNEQAEVQLGLALGELVPFSVVEIIALEKRKVTDERAQVLASQAGCSLSEIVVMEGLSAIGEQVWPVFRCHLETDDPRKAQTKALWLRRDRDQVGHGSGSICIMAHPFEAPGRGG